MSIAVGIEVSMKLLKFRESLVESREDMVVSWRPCLRMYL